MKRQLRCLAAAAIAAALLSGACVSVGVDSYEEFRSAVDGGASCEQLIDIRNSFDDGAERARIQRDLDEIGCETRDSRRTDL